MPLFSAFCSGSNAERSLTMDAEQTVNLYRTSVDAASPAKAAYLQGAPGLRALGQITDFDETITTIGVGAPTPPGGRGLFTQDGRTWTVVGATLYELTFGPFTATARGTIRNDTRPVAWASNGDGGSQLAIVGGGQLHVLNLVTNVLSGPVALPLTGAPICIGYIDAYFVLSEQNSLRFWFSHLENGLLWDALDFATRSTASDHIVGLACGNNRVWLFGSETSEAYEDTGDADNPFQPIKGSLFQIGLSGVYTLTLSNDTLRWIGQSSRGGPAVYRLSGYNGLPLSTHAVDAALTGATTLTTAEGLSYEAEGHNFYAVTVPGAGVAGQTHVVDEAEQNSWHQRSHWNASAGREEQWRVRGHVYVGQTHIVGSRDSGAIWALDPDTYDDDGGILRARRRAPYLGAENAYACLDRVELGIEMGVGLASGQGSDPQVELLVSTDTAKTWWSAGAAAIGAIGASDAIGAVWTRLGQVRIDRLVLEVVITDPVKRAIGPGLWITATPGRAAA